MTNPAAGEKASQHDYFHFTATEYSRFHQFLHPLDLPASQIVYNQGALATTLYLIKSGTVSLQHTPSTGKVDRLTVVQTGQAFGQAALWLEEGRHAETARTLEPCSLLALVRQNFILLQNKGPGLMIKLLCTLQQQTYQEWLGARAEFHILTARLAGANILI